MADPMVLGGRYELGERLGHGGMADVFLGRDLRLGRDVAVKVLRADLARDPAFIGRFRREAQSAAGLNHPNIVAVYDTGEENGVPYIVMEYVAGRTLRDVLAEDGRLLPRRALEITAEVCAALEYSHRAGIVHRDIKPANVMLTRAGDVKVMDFGIARAASASTSTMTQTSTVLGTAQYLSPEQARGEHVDARSDIYSTGCLLYELLTGVPPFQGDSPVAVAYQHVREDPLPPSSIDPELPASLDAVVLKAMAKNPANRYQTAADFETDVGRAAAGRRVEATPILDVAQTSVLAAASPTTVVLRPERNERTAGKRIAYMLLIFAVLLVFILGALLTKNLFSHTATQVNVPQVTGLTQAAAEQDLTAAKLKYMIVLTPVGEGGNNSRVGLVYNQSPLNGFFEKTGEIVTLYVSSGAEKETVPMVTNLSLANATALLSAHRLKVGTVTQENVAGTTGTVLTQSPAANTATTAGDSVNLTVVSGAQPVPDVTNQSFASAATTLQSAGFVVARQDLPNSLPSGIVFAENPPGGQTEPTGTTITLQVSSGPASTSPTVTSSSGSPSTSTSTSTTPTAPSTSTSISVSP